jgi:hypothetical protein
LGRTVNYISCVFIGYKNVFGPIAVLVTNRFRLEQKSYLPLKLQFISGWWLNYSQNCDLRYLWALQYFNFNNNLITQQCLKWTVAQSPKFPPSINMWSLSRRWHGWNDFLSLSMWQFHLYYLLNEFDEAFFGRKFSLYWICLCWNMIFQGFSSTFIGIQILSSPWFCYFRFQVLSRISSTCTNPAIKIFQVLFIGILLKANVDGNLSYDEYIYICILFRINTMKIVTWRWAAKQGNNPHCVNISKRNPPILNRIQKQSIVL